jgi:hypothetical protein
MFPQPEIDLLPDLASGEEEDVRIQVWGLLTMLYPQHASMERRRGQRYPFPHLIQLTPVAHDGVTPVGPSVVVAGKHISENGLGFYHPQPLPHRRMIATLDAGHSRQLSFLVDISWCRFTRLHWYESGGQFLQAVDPPTTEA